MHQHLWCPQIAGEPIAASGEWWLPACQMSLSNAEQLALQVTETSSSVLG